MSSPNTSLARSAGAARAPGQHRLPSLLTAGARHKRRRPLVGVVVNPHSGRNRRDPERYRQLISTAGTRGIVRVTRGVDELPAVLREFVTHGVTHWVVDGGDGTLNAVLAAGRRLLSSRGVPPILPLASGSMNVVARHVGLARGGAALLDALCSRLALGEPPAMRQVDTMAIRGLRRNGDRLEPFETVGFAATLGGVGQRFFEKLDRYSRRGPRQLVDIFGRTAGSWLAGRMPGVSRYAPGLTAFADDIFRPTRARVVVDGEPARPQDFTGINIASVPVNFANVLRVFGRAAEPGRLHALYGDASPATLLRSIPAGVAGRAPRGDGIVDRTCREMLVEARGTELLNPVIDGDTFHDVLRIHLSLGEPLWVPLTEAAGEGAPIGHP